MHWKRQYGAYYDEIRIETPTDVAITITQFAAGVPVLPGQSYYFRIYALNRAGDGAASNEVQVFTAGPPSAPINLNF